MASDKTSCRSRCGFLAILFLFNFRNCLLHHYRGIKFISISWWAVRWVSFNDQLRGCLLMSRQEGISWWAVRGIFPDDRLGGYLVMSNQEGISCLSRGIKNLDWRRKTQVIKWSEVDWNKNTIHAICLTANDYSATQKNWEHFDSQFFKLNSHSGNSTCQHRRYNV